MTLRLALRLARRELWRRPWRTALVVLMVLIPASVMTAVVTLVRATEWSAADEAAALYGRADGTANLDGANRPPTPDQVAELRSGLPRGSRVLIERRVYDRSRRGRARVYLQVSDVRLDDPMVEGRFTDLRGRLARTPSEAVITDELSRKLHVSRGDSFGTDRTGRQLTVVGVVRQRAGHDNLAFVPGPLPALPSFENINPENINPDVVWVDLPGRDGAADDSAAGQRVGPQRIGPWSLGLVHVEPASGSSAVFWTYVGGGVGLVVLSTIITAAFAVGARRQLRSVGLLSASGASPSAIRWFLAAQGALAGLIGAALGALVGAVGVRQIPRRYLDGVADHAVEAVRTRPIDVVPILVICVLVASVAAWLPARSTARIPTLRALAGRRPLPRVPARLPVIGVAAVGMGCALLAMAVAGARNGGSSLWSLAAVTGAVGVLLGTIAVAPFAIAGLERASARLPGSWRLAGRSLSRSRVRSSAVVGAVCAVTIAVVALGTMASSKPIHRGLPYVRDDQLIIDMSPNAPVDAGEGTSRVPTIAASVRARIDRLAPGGQWVRLDELVRADAVGGASAEVLQGVELTREGARAPLFGSVAEATPELLDLFRVSADLRRSLREGRAVVVIDSQERHVPIDLPGTPAREVELRVGGSFASPEASSALPSVLLSPTTVRRLGLVSRPSPQTLVALPSALTSRQHDDLSLLSEDLRWDQSQAGPGSGQLIVPNDEAGPSPALIKAGLLAVSLALVLAVVAVGLALAAKDSEDERQVLLAVGARPKTLRRLGALRAVLLVLVAVILSVPAGLLSAAAIVAASEADPDRQPAFRPDGWGLLFVTVLLPVGVGLATWLGGRLRDAVRPARADVFAFGE